MTAEHRTVATFRQRIVGGLLGAVDLLSFAASLAGASVSLFLGKLFASVLFAFLAVGVLNRFVRRRRGDVAYNQPTPLWVLAASLALSVVEAAAIVEASNLPVRFDQPGFEKSNWLFVVALLLVLFYVQRYVFLRLVARRRRADAL